MKTHRYAAFTGIAFVVLLLISTAAASAERDGYRFEQDITVQLSNTEDANEAQRAFAEKRKPGVQGALM